MTEVHAPATHQRIALFAGPVLAGIVWVWVEASGLSHEMAWTAAVTTLCAVWWIFEAIPIPATSLLPIAALPLFGILTPTQVGAAYGSPLIILMLGGFILSTAMARSGVHRRIALMMVRLFGGHAGRELVLGFMVAAAVLSMWISNTATCLMLLPIALAVCERLEKRRMQVALLLGIMYGCSIGGIGTPIGTPPNLMFLRVYSETTGYEPTFTEWMGWSLPIVVIMIPLAALWLSRGMKKGDRIDLPDSGPWRSEEKRTLAVFACTALAWITRKEPFGGWSDWFGLESANDASVALLAVVAMFLIPNGKGQRLLDWETAVTIPWGILILFGGGVAIAMGFAESGLSARVGDALAGMTALPIAVIMLLIALCVSFLTEITSNTATTALLMPILAATGVAAGLDPKLLMVPAAISASFAFMLPVATGPNAVVFGSGMFTVEEMAREGFVLNIVGAVVVSSVLIVLLT
jgi:sodium-dependent dicarboxylate transporter 2/3/5